MKRLLSCTLVALLLLTGCTTNASSTNEVTTVDSSYDESSATKISLTDLSIDGNGASVSDNIITITKAGTYIVSGSNEVRIVVDLIAKGDVKIVLRDAELTYSSGPAILISEASSTNIIIDEGTTSSITVTSEDSEEGDGAIKSHDDLIILGTGTLNITSGGDGIHGNDTLTIQGTTLNIQAEDDGLDVNDLITINQATINITTQDGASESTNTMQEMPQGNMGNFDPTQNEGMMPLSSEDGTQMSSPSGDSTMEPPTNDSTQMTPPDMNTETTESSTSEDDEQKAKGIKCDGDITITDSTITVNSSDDAIHTNSNFTTTSSSLTLSATDDAIHADETLTIHSGEINIDMCYEGLEALYIVINDGTINITASDDAINASNPESTSNDMISDGSKLTINDGTIMIDAEGDGIDSNGDVEINGGITTVYGPTNGGNGALDYVSEFNVNGGELIAGGSAGMAVMPSSTSSLNSLMVDASGTTEIKDSDGNTILTYSSNKTYSNLVYASEMLVTGETYTIYVDGTETTTVTIEEGCNDVSTASSSGMEGNTPQGQMPQSNIDNNITA